MERRSDVDEDMATSSEASVLRAVKRHMTTTSSPKPILNRAATLAKIPETRERSYPTISATNAASPVPSINGGSRFVEADSRLHHPITVAQSLPVRGHARSKSTDHLEEDGYVVSECPICLTEFWDEGLMVPRNLFCGHTYCTGCLQKLIIKLRLPPFEIPCPKCSTPTAVKDGNVENLPRNYALMEVIISASLHSSSVSPRASPVMGRRRISQKEDGKQEEDNQLKPQYCQEHGDHLSSYCITDGQLICSTCLYYGSLHKHHRTLLVKDAAKESRQKLRVLNPEVLQQKRRMEQALSEISTLLEDVQSEGGRLVDEADGHFNTLVQLIDERRARVKLEIMERTQLRVHALMEQVKELGESIQQATVVHRSSESLLKSDDFTLLNGTLITTEQIEGVFINPPATNPRANADLMCEFSNEPCDELASLLEGFGNIRSSVGTIKQPDLEAYHDGIRISWTAHNFVDNYGITYHLQMATSHEDSKYTNIYRGGNTKFTWKPQELEDKVTYRFRVQVRTTEGVGNWSEPKEIQRAAPGFRWHTSWRNVKISLSPDKLQAMWCSGGTHKYWATFAGDRFFEGPGQHYMEIEIINLGKPRPAKKLAIGVVSCSKAKAGSLPWHDGKYSIGQWRDVKSWSLHPISGVITSSSLPLDGKPYADVNLQNGDRIGMLVNMDEGTLSFFCNGQDLGVAFESEEVGVDMLLPAVSIRDKICVRLRFPPPPYANRTIRLLKLHSRLHSTNVCTP